MIIASTKSEGSVNVVGISDLQHDAARLVEHVRRTHEPVQVCHGSKPVAYLIDAEQFEAMQRDLKRLRHDLFWQGVAEAEAEHRRGQSKSCGDVDALIADLELEG